MANFNQATSSLASRLRLRAAHARLRLRDGLHVHVFARTQAAACALARAGACVRMHIGLRSRVFLRLRSCYCSCKRQRSRAIARARIWARTCIVRRHNLLIIANKALQRRFPICFPDIAQRRSKWHPGFLFGGFMHLNWDVLLACDGNALNTATRVANRRFACNRKPPPLRTAVSEPLTGDSD